MNARQAGVQDLGGRLRRLRTLPTRRERVELALREQAHVLHRFTRRRPRSWR